MAALAFLAPGACSAEPATKTSPVSSAPSIKLTGRIDATSLQAFKRGLSPQTERLIINSAGGRSPEAMELGSLVRSLGLEVVVDGVCLSACAHFVFIPAKRKRLEPNSVVAFHQTATALSRLLLASGRQDLAAFYLPVAENEQAFYKSAGISTKLLNEPYRELNPICYQEQTGAPQGSEYQTAFFSQTSFYVPALSDLYGFGVGPIQGYWPSSTSDIGKAVARYPRKLNLSFKMKLATSGRDVTYQPKALPKCPEEPMYQLPRRPVP
ncbi:MAG TPA: hypothetical protein VF655_06465 [Allosphingosinicella sp.]